MTDETVTAPAAPAADGEPTFPIVYVLKHPFQLGSEQVARLSFKRPKGEHMRRVPADVGPMNALMKWAGILAGVTDVCLDLTDGEDLNAIFGIVSPLMASPDMAEMAVQMSDLTFPIVVPLKYPVMSNKGEEHTALTFHRPKGRDIRAIKDTPNLGTMLSYAAKLTNTDDSVIDLLDYVDLKEVVKTIVPLFPRPGDGTRPSG